MSGRRRPWFRHWNEAATSRKLRQLSDREERVYWWLCCAHGRGKLVGVPDEAVAWELRMEVEEVTQMRDVLTKRGLLDADGAPHDWSEWNDREDPAQVAERARRYRARQREATEEEDHGSDTAASRGNHGKRNGPRAEQSTAEQRRAEQGRADQKEEAPPRPRAAAASSRDGAKLQAFGRWCADLEAKAIDEGAPAGAAARLIEEAIQGLESYYQARGGRWTPTRAAFLAARLAELDVDAQLSALEVYCDCHAGSKDEKYLAGIAAARDKMQPEERDADIDRHRSRHPAGVWAGTVGAA